MSAEIGTAVLLAEPAHGSGKNAATKEPLALTAGGFASALDLAQAGEIPKTDIAKIEPTTTDDADPETDHAAAAALPVAGSIDLALMLVQMSAAANATQAAPVQLTSTAQPTPTQPTATQPTPTLAGTNKTAPVDALTPSVTPASATPLPLHQSAEAAAVVSAVRAETGTSATQAAPVRLTSTAQPTPTQPTATQPTHTLAVTNKTAPVDALTPSVTPASATPLPLHQSAEAAAVVSAVMAETAIDTTVAVTDRSAMLTRSDTAQQSAVSLALSSEVKVTTGAEVELLSSIKVANATEIAPASTQTNLAPHAESPTAKPDAKVALSEPSSIAPAEVLVNGQRPQTQPESTPFGNVSKFPAQFASSSVANSSHRLAAAVATPPSAILPLSAQWVSTMGDMVARAQQRQPGKNSVQPDYSVAGIWGQSALASDLQFNALPASTGTLTPNLAAGIADTVAYWAAQGVQNAELKLDGFGEHPVQVHIALNGDQAQIGFRTDQPEIRAILEGANGPLKELLRSEGLTLTGVSVGSSGERSAAQDQGAAGGHRQRSLISPVPTVTVHSVRGVQPTPAGVDIFV